MPNLLKDALAGILKPITDIVDKAVPDKDLAKRINADITKLEIDASLQRDLKQIALNMVESAQGLFKGGWRPFIGWTCGFAFAYSYVLQPFLIFGFTMAGYGEEVAKLPDIALWEMMPVLAGMLGLSYHRSGDKRDGVHKT